MSAIAEAATLAPNPYQRTAAWHNDRTGCLTASRFPDALDFRKDGKPGAKRIALAKKIIAERMTGDIGSQYVTPAMQRGIDLEPAARAAYQAETGHIVQLVGFIPHPTIEFCGCSPDGLLLLDPDGLVELKCPNTETHVEWMLDPEAPAQHHPQMLLQLACTRRKYVDFYSYDDRVRDRKLQGLLRRFEPTPAAIAEAEEQAQEFLALIDQMWERIHS